MSERFFRRLSAYISMIALGAKSHFKSVAGMAFGAFAAPLIIAAVFIAIGPVLAGALSHAKLNLIFCDLEGSAYFDTVLNLLLADESITKTIGVKKLGYDEALAELGAGAADAVVVFPESFISDMTIGINKPVKIIGNESDPVRTVFIREFIQSAAAELSAAQSAINTVWFHMDLQNMSDARRNIVFTTLVFEFTSKAFARSIYYTFENVEPPYKGSSPATHIITSAIAALLFFGSLPGIKQVLSERELGITSRLAASGRSGAGSVFYQFAPIYLRQLLCAALAILIALPASAAAAAALGSDPGGAGGAEYESSQETGAATIIGGVVGGAIDAARGGRNGDGPQTGEQPDAAGVGQGETRVDELSDEAQKGGRFNLSSLLKAIAATATAENASRLALSFLVVCVLCLFTSSVSLFAGYMFRRAESAEILIVTLGIIMAIAGGTLIPYQYMPDAFKAFGPFTFNKWAQDLIASALYGGNAGYVTNGTAFAAARTAFAASRTAFIAPLAAFTALAAALFSVAVWKNKRMI